MALGYAALVALYIPFRSNEGDFSFLIILLRHVVYDVNRSALYHQLSRTIAGTMDCGTSLCSRESNKQPKHPGSPSFPS